jgi:hypothetical protein
VSIAPRRARARGGGRAARAARAVASAARAALCCQPSDRRRTLLGRGYR